MTFVSVLRLDEARNAVAQPVVHAGRYAAGEHYAGGERHAGLERRAAP